MNDKSVLEDFDDQVSKDALSGENNNKETEKTAPGKKAARKLSAKVAPKAAKVDKPVAKKETAKKAAPKKATAKKAETVEPEPVKEKKAATKKAIAPAKKAPAKKQAKAVQTDSIAPIAVPENVLPQEQLVTPEETNATNNIAENEIAPPVAEVTEPAAPATTSTLKKITFQLKFHTVVGQSLYVTGNHVLLGNNDASKAFPLRYLNDEYWYGTLEIPADTSFKEPVIYNYVLRDIDGSSHTDWGDDKIINPSTYTTEELLFVDAWTPSSAVENTFYAEPFQQVLLNANLTEVSNHESQTVTHIFRVKAPLLETGETICIVGSIPQFGLWDTESPLLLSRGQGESWYSVGVDLSNAVFPCSYKYGIYNVETKQFVRYETGRNRDLYDPATPGKLTRVSDGFAALTFKPFKGAGVAIPVFSLRSQQSFGVGEFTDLKLMVDWAKQVGLKLVQLLPVNDTTATHTFTDSYPYAAISAFALHPLYLHLPSIVNEQNRHLLNELEEKRAELNGKTEIDYVAVMAEKWKFIKQVFPAQKQETFNDNDFKAFFDENAHWLVPYAAFSYFREKYNTSDFTTWPTKQTFNAEEINQLAASPLEVDEAISEYYFVQYHLHLQLKEAANYAHENGIIVKGDIPIGIYRNSCDAWQGPEFFHMDMQAGAPPDDFAIKGQNWGFPTYNWQRMREDGFSWWKKRFNQMSYYFDAFRIDHILGFFRIWSIPMDAVQGIMGHFVPAVPVHINEFEGRGLHFDVNRFCKPYINDAVLWEVFGHDAETIKAEFLDATASGYVLKPSFDTQRKVEAYFSNQENSEQNDKTRDGLYDLLSNVILFEVPESDGQQFHFRIAVDSISSFRHLDAHTQHHVRGLYNNYFYRRQDHFWMKEAMLKLPELKRSTNMLICGEDLGMVPACVPGVMKELAILSLEIQRMPKDPTREFFHPNDAPYLSVVTPSTHDMSTVRGWWEEDRSATQRFFNAELGQWGTAPYFCEPWINKIILMQHLYSPAMWSIFQLQDILGINGAFRRENPHEERINVPANPKHYWRYRMHMTLEELMNETGFTDELRNYILQSGR